jgi:hypothetical protein
VEWLNALTGRRYQPMSTSISANITATTNAIGRVAAWRMFCRSCICFVLVEMACVTRHSRAARGWVHPENYGVGYWLLGIQTGLGFGA